jgi:hypothetical protein
MGLLQYSQKPVMLLMDRAPAFERLEDSPALDLRNINEAGWQQILSSCRALELRLYHTTTPSLLGIDMLRTTLRLAIEWANKISNLSPVFKMTRLECLCLSDFPSLRSIAGIESIQGLTELHLSGNRGSLNPPLRLDSIKPIAQLARLKKLTIQNVKLEDDDVTPIAALSSLRDLTISDNFERKQIAFLAKHLNSQLIAPITAYRETNLLCRKCGTALYIFTGRRMPTVCTSCDSRKFERLTVEFKELQES